MILITILSLTMDCDHVLKYSFSSAGLVIREDSVFFDRPASDQGGKVIIIIY